MTKAHIQCFVVSLTDCEKHKTHILGIIRHDKFHHQYSVFILQHIGCDLVVGSSTKKDRCGVCRGDNSSCKLVSDTFTQQPRDKGECTSLSPCQLTITLDVYLWLLPIQIFRSLSLPKFWHSPSVFISPFHVFVIKDFELGVCVETREEHVDACGI